jgi:hypothetical protein
MEHCAVQYSDYMYNQIRSPPNSCAQVGRGGEIIMAQFGNQYQIETQILSVMYILLAGVVVFLAIRVPAMSPSSSSYAVQQRLAGFIGLGVFWLLASAFVRIFIIKNGGYPFKLLF